MAIIFDLFLFDLVNFFTFRDYQVVCFRCNQGALINDPGLDECRGNTYIGHGRSKYQVTPCTFSCNHGVPLCLSTQGSHSSQIQRFLSALPACSVNTEADIPQDSSNRHLDPGKLWTPLPSHCLVTSPPSSKSVRTADHSLYEITGIMYTHEALTKICGLPTTVVGTAD